MATDEHVTLFDRWLEETRKLQNEAFDGNYPMPDGDARAVEFAQQFTACVVELAEMSQEIGWKPWGKNRGIDREKYLKEGVDVLHFVANLLTMVGITDEELNAAYLVKMQKNRDRMAAGDYDGRVQGKCQRCKRELDDSAKDSGSCYWRPGDVNGWCAEYGVYRVGAAS